MSLQLLEMRHSPYCIPIARMLEACGLDFDRVEIPNWDRRKVAEVTHGAYYQVPVLVDGSTVVFDTVEEPFRVARYVDKQRGGGTFFPKEWTGVHELLLSHIEDTLEGMAFKLCDIHYVSSIADVGERTMVLRHKERRYGVGCLDQWKRDAAALKTRFQRALEPLDARLRHSLFLLREQPVFADFALFGILGNYTFKEYNRFPSGFPSLQAWYERMAGYRIK